MVAVPWLQHSHRLGHCALSQTVCNRRSEMSALVEKKTGFDGNRTLIHGGFCAWCNAGSIFAQDIVAKLFRAVVESNLERPRGEMEYWSVGVMDRSIPITPILHYSIHNFVRPESA